MKHPIPDVSFAIFLNQYVFQDLKKYHFYYWFCFPALCFPEGIKIVQPAAVLEQVFSAKQVVSCYVNGCLCNKKRI